MSVDILMPALSPTMEEGTLAKWLVKEGDSVASGDVIAEIETDKATMEVEAVDEGIVAKLIVAAGTEGVAVNAVIAVLAEEGEDPASVQAGGGGAPAPSTAPAPEPLPAPVAAAPEKAPVAAAVPVAAPATGGDRVLASPLARRLASQNGLDLSAIGGSGPNGRVVKRDIEAAIAGGGAKAAPRAAASAPSTAAAGQPMPASAGAGAGPDPRKIAAQLDMAYEEIPANNMRKTIARRLVEAKQTVPHFYLTVDIELDALLALRSQINKAVPEGVKISVNDMIILASAKALMDESDTNASWAGDAVLKYASADVAVAVATENGLITPVIRDVQTKGLPEISAEMVDLATRAREGRLKPHEYQGGTFTISNLGMFGIREFAAVINPPHG
ncbi:MAG: pyruvate dehydrogenase complex dihydrolipoamide acetyltransferase, partial [Pseudomonadota bacterium]|nr:pyruvate dehydrogenase complex dihydrolipoamide acetyltransferase [Pseudomonadota bacterium]